jgi:hypothetical protein
MVTKKELSGFKKTLTTALQNAGYTAYGRISSSEEIYNFYAHLPEQEMVSQYVEDNNLDEINRVYRIIKFISENGGNNYSLKTLCKEHGIDYKIFAHAVENLPYIDKTGNRRTTQYHWIHEQEPSFAAAKDFVEHMRKLKSTKLSKGLKDKIRQAVADDVSKDEFFKANKIKREATYSADAYYNYQKVHQQKKEDAITEIMPESTAEPESLSIISESALPYPESASEESVVRDEEVQPEPEVMDDAGLQAENYILRQEIKYLRKINKAKDKLIKALRRKA